MKAIIIFCLLANLYPGQNNAPVVSHKPEIIDVTTQKEDLTTERLQRIVSGKRLMSEVNQMKAVLL